MRKLKKEKINPNRCIDCVHAHPDESFSNLDYDGKYILYTCKYQNFSFLRDDEACYNFKHK